MNSSFVGHPGRRLSRFGAIFLLAAAGRSAVPPAAPELFAGELDDVGPQYLLLETARPTPLELWTALEITGTSNATLVEANPTASTLTVAQGGGTWHFAPREAGGGHLALDTGFRLQTYRYGLLSGRKRKINFLEIDRNDFNLVGAHVAASWWRDRWLAVVAARGASLRNLGNHRVFYQEAAIDWQVFRQWRLAPRRSLTLGGEGAARRSHTDSFGLLAPGWNNRVEQALLGVLDQGIGLKWHLQPMLRVQGSRYTHPDRHRDDVHVSGRIGLVRSFGRGELQFALGYDRRDSSEPIIADFEKWDLSLGGRAQFRF